MQDCKLEWLTRTEIVKRHKAYCHLLLGGYFAVIFNSSNYNSEWEDKCLPMGLRRIHFN